MNSEIKPVIKTAEQRYDEIKGSETFEDRQSLCVMNECHVSEAAELRAALEALQQENAEQSKRIAHLEYKIDELMLEYCPDEMTPEQLENYAKHQRKASM